MSDREDSYEILGLKPGASREEIKQACRDLAKVWHPDRFQNDPRLQQRAQEQLSKINQAYERLLRSSRWWKTSASPGRTKPQPEAERARTRPFSPRGFRAKSVRGAHVGFWLLVAAVFATSAVFYWTVRQPPARVEPEPAIERELVPRPQSAPAVADSRPAIPAAPKAERGPVPSYFTLGSSAREVLAIQGRPTKSDAMVWEYGRSKVFFQNGRVIKWDSTRTDPLRGRIISR